MLAAELAYKIRDRDRQEIRALLDMDAFGGLVTMMNLPGARTWMFFDSERRVQGAFGVVVMDGVCMPWMCGSDFIEKNPITFLKGSKQVVSQWFETHNAIGGHVGADNTVSQKWLEWLGFTIDRTKTHSQHGDMKFYPFKYYTHPKGG
jgi:hypothetical protein